MRFFCTENLVYNVHSETGSKFDKQIYKFTKKQWFWETEILKKKLK